MDVAEMCFEGVEGSTLTVQVSWECAIDHEGAELSCTAAYEGDDVRVRSVYREGEDPDDSCPGDLVATCAVELKEPGELCVRYGDEAFSISVPDDMDPAC